MQGWVCESCDASCMKRRMRGGKGAGRYTLGGSTSRQGGMRGTCGKNERKQGRHDAGERGRGDPNGGQTKSVSNDRENEREEEIQKRRIWTVVSVGDS